MFINDDNNNNNNNNAVINSNYERLQNFCFALQNSRGHAK